MDIKVLFLTNIPSPYRVQFFEGLGKLCDLTVIYESTKSNDRNDNWYKNSSDNYNPVFCNGIKIKTDSYLCPIALKYLFAKKYDLIVLDGYTSPTSVLAIILFKLFKKKFILSCDGGLIKRDKKFIYIIKKFLINSAAYYLSTGKECDKYLLYYGAEETSIYRYPFSSISEKLIIEEPISYSNKVKIRKALDMQENKIIISVGRFIQSKGFDVLIKACADLPEEYGVYIIGGTPTEEYLRLMKLYKVKNIHFIDFMNMKDLTMYYRASDVFVFPTRSDVWGLVINEAMANGLPIITTEKCIAGLELVTNEENGFVIPADDADILVSKLINILSNDEILNKMAQKSLSKIRSYTIENMIITHMDIFNKILFNK